MPAAATGCVVNVSPLVAVTWRPVPGPACPELAEDDGTTGAGAGGRNGSRGAAGLLALTPSPGVATLLPATGRPTGAAGALSG